ncbi:conserved virulence factor C family protein [Bacillus smithii]|uniref:Scaffold protein Nfu/NifU N-terminal domain-containing protein n=1 Tax=Bacillus smithii 7_3_47FAA TaxID=665952 RepID=G9QNZ1_9BACI|nr:conserved virulence factor C family protein [Bacillus smithii]EHL74536.1 hypothetical protein HMPREF1015_00008 [Bacillus smithii 7_3_47FAA]
MKIVAIEPTPSPNTMKIILDEELPSGKSHNYKKEQSSDAPSVIADILKIDGVKGVYHVADFLAVERNGKYDWQQILPKVRRVFGEEVETKPEKRTADEHFGEVKVSVQMFKGIPLQIKLNDGQEEKRFGLPQEFLKAFEAAQQDGDNFVLQRTWKDYGVRYGDMDEIGKSMIEEITALYTQERLDVLVDRARQGERQSEYRPERVKLTPEMLDEPDWRKRYQLLERMEDPTLDDLPLLEKAMNDDKIAIRRLAVVYVGMIKDKKVLPLLYKALKDPVVAVRRTAGDCLSDLGFKEAIPAMCEALKDKSKIVRWRAAMYLYEVGDETALPALKAAENDPEFEVQMQIKMAIERIEGGQEGKGSVWKQMTEARKNEKSEEKK